MSEQDLAEITETIEGYHVKDLRWLSRDNIIVGLVKCPYLGVPNLFEGYTSGMWKRNGIPTNKIRGHEHLTLKMKKDLVG
jgi:hypothetical protein